MSTFKRRRIDVTITIGGGRFGEDVEYVHTLTNHRVSLSMQQNGGLAQGELNVSIYGVKLELLNRLTAIGTVMNQTRWKNLIQIDAGNDGEKLTTIFTGSINTAYADLNSMPDAPLIINAFTAGALAVRPADPVSYSEPVDIARALSDLAGKMELSLELNGVGGILLDRPYFEGSLLDQLKQLIESVAAVNFSINNNILSVWYKDKVTLYPAQKISPESGMVGYPTFSSQGMIIKHLFLPFAQMGGLIEVMGSQIAAANYKWQAYMVFHELDSIVPDGNWFTTIGVQSHHD